MKTFYKILVGALLISSPLTAQEMGFVNLKKCVEKSKLGKKEKTSFETLKKQLGENLAATDKELGELAKKLEDQDFMDSLSPASEEELKTKFQKLSQEFVRYQNQYYQLLNQANYKLLQSLQAAVCKASEKIRSQKKLSYILSEEAAFAFDPTLDLSEEVVVEMDRLFDETNKETP